MKFAAPRRRRDCAAGKKKFELLRAFSAATVLVSTAWPIASNATTDLPADPVPPSGTAGATSTDTGTGTDTAHDGVVSGGTLKAVTVTGSNLQRASTYAPKTVSTGQYRGLDALDVPATVNVVTRDVLTAQAATGIYDALRNVAGVVRQQLSGIAYDQLSIRGIALDNRTSYYLNGVLPIDNNIWMPMEDKDRVEVLKGASALYYGFAVPAGIVNMVTKRAGNTPVTSASLLVDSNGSVGAHADVARRFGTDNQFGIRVNAMDEHLETPITGDRGYRKFESVALDWRANDRLSFKYDLEHIDERVVEQAGITPLAAVNGVIALPRLPDASTLLVPNDKKTNATATSQLLRADYLISENWSANVSVGQSITHPELPSK